MSQHHATIAWQRNSTPFDYHTYPRDHTWSFGGGIDVPASAAPDFLGSDERVDPEEAYVAALSSCHMLTFLAIAAKRKFIVDSYTDNAVGYLEKDEDNRLCITRVALHPNIAFADDAGPTAEELKKLHDSAHANCFIANSVNTVIEVET